MALTKYSYNISTDFPNSKVDIYKLQLEINPGSDIITALDRIDSDETVCDIWFKDALSSEDQTILNNIVEDHDGIPLEKDPVQVSLTGDTLNNYKAQKVSIYPTEGNGGTFISHDYTDKTTWYGESIKVEEEVLSTSDNQTYSATSTHWIDLTHGKVTKEDDIAANYPIVIMKNDVTVTEGFTVNYASGSITFDSPLLETDVVKATFNYATGSTWTVQPPPGKIYRIEHTELQFTKDCIINGSTIFEIWVYNPADFPNKMLYFREAYKNVKDYINISNEGTGYIPALGGEVNGIANDVLVFPFKYNSTKDLIASYGTELRVYVEGDVPHDGEFATLTLYILEENES